MGLDSIVNVTITKGTKAVSQAGFGVPMILGNHTRFVERIRFYSSFTGVQADFQPTDAEYKAAQAVFGQAKKPTKIAIGRRLTAVAQSIDFTPVAVNNFTYTITLNGVVHTFVSDGSATVAEITAGLVAAIQGGSQAPYLTAVDNGPGTKVRVTSDFAGLPFSYDQSANITAAVNAAHVGVDTDLADMDVANPQKDWYALILTSRTVTDILTAAAKIEAQRRIFGACSDDADVLTSVTTDIASQLKAKGYARTFYFWSADQDAYPEAALMGLVLPEAPGSETWKFKTLAGVAADDDLTETEETNLQFKNANYYKTIAGIAITQEGKMAVGASAFIDITRGIDWLQARLQERIFSRLANSVKVPYTDAGVGIIEAEVRAQLNEGVRVGLLASNPAPTVTVPLVANISPVDRANRLLPDVSFDATLAGAIHAVTITGLVSV